MKGQARDQGNSGGSDARSRYGGDLHHQSDFSTREFSSDHFGFRHEQLMQSDADPSASPSFKTPSSSLSHALDIDTDTMSAGNRNHQQKGKQPELPDSVISSQGDVFWHNEGIVTAGEHTGAGGPVTNEELEAFLSSKPWNQTRSETLAEFDGENLPFEVAQFPMPTQQSQDTSSERWQNEASLDDSLWTGFRDPSVSNAQQGEMEWDVSEPKSPLMSDPSLSPSSLSIPFSSGVSEPPEHTQQSSHHVPTSNGLSLAEDRKSSRHFSGSSSSLGGQPTGGIASPRSHMEALSSPEGTSSKAFLNPSRSHLGSLRSLQEHQRMLKATASSSPVQVRKPSITTQNTRSPEHSLTTARRRAVRRTYTGPSTSTSLSSERSMTRTGPGPIRPSSSSGPSSSNSPSLPLASTLADATNIRARADTVSASLSPSSRPTQPLREASSMPHIEEGNPLDQLSMQRLQQPERNPDSTTTQTGNPNEISGQESSQVDRVVYDEKNDAWYLPDGGVRSLPSSLSAELAGLGLNVSDLYGPEKEDVLMEDQSSFAIQRDSSHSSPTHRRGQESSTGESSFLSHQSSSTGSSGLDDSLLSIGGDQSNRWIHGKDTPPSSPAPSSRYQHSYPRIDVKRTESSNNSYSSINGTSPALSRSKSGMGPVDEFGSFAEPEMRPGAGDWSRTWPRATSQQQQGPIQSGPQSIHQSSYTTKSQISPMHGSKPNTTSLEPPASSRQVGAGMGTSPWHSGRPSSSNSAQERRTALRGISSTSSPLLQRQSRIISPSSSRGRMLETINAHSSDSARQQGSLGEKTPSEGVSSEIDPAPPRDHKRRSNSSLSSYKSGGIGVGLVDDSRRRRQVLREEQSTQFDQVSSALDTLRTFLRQRSNDKGTLSPSTPTMTSPVVATSTSASQSQRPQSMVVTSADAARLHMALDNSLLEFGWKADDRHTTPSVGEARGLEPSPSGRPPRTLRHPPSGPLPPRGSIPLEDALHHSPQQAEMERNNWNAAVLRPSSDDFRPQIQRPHSRSVGESSSSSMTRPLSMSTSSSSSALSGGTTGSRASGRTVRGRSGTTSGGLEAGRIATLNDLAERIRAMREESRLKLDQEEELEDRQQRERS